jgi:hypothetical protein
MHLRPWYREPLVWLVIAFPLTAVIAGLTTLYIANRTHDGLVVDDYYQKGKEINKSLARDQAAARHGLSARLQLDANHQQVVAHLAGRNTAVPGLVTLRWLHATRAGQDRTQELVRAADGSFRAAFPELVPGHWYVHLEAQDWRLQGSLHVPAETRLVLAPVISGGASAR